MYSKCAWPLFENLGKAFLVFLFKYSMPNCTIFEKYVGCVVLKCVHGVQKCYVQWDFVLETVSRISTQELLKNSQ